MSLYLTLRVNAIGIGELEIKRTTRLREVAPPANSVNAYEVRLDGQFLGMVRHRYGAGPWALVVKAAGLADHMARTGHRPAGPPPPPNLPSTAGTPGP